jgi:hypothetical protein
MLFLGLITLAFTFRLALAESALRHALADVGATDIMVAVTELSPRHLGIQSLGFAVGGRHLQIGKITLDRPAMFSGSLGRVRLEGVAATLDLTAPQSAATLAKKAVGAPAKKALLPEVPFEQIQIEGRLTLTFRDGSQVLTIGVNAKPAGRSRVDLKAHVAGPGLAVAGHGELDLGMESGEFAVEDFRLELKPWSGLLAAVMPSEVAGWVIDGTVTGDARAKFEPGVITGAAALHVRDGAVRNEAKKVSAGGFAANVSVVARQADGQPRLQVDADLTGPGFTAKGNTESDLAMESGEFALQGVRLELKPWSDFLFALAPAAAGFELDGVVTGDAHGRIGKAAITGTATLCLRDGSLRNPAKGVSAEGIVADLVFPNLPKLISAPHQIISVGKAQIGAVNLQHGEVDLQIASEQLMTVNAASVEAFGGRLSTEPFAVDLAKTDYAVTILADGIEIADVLALFPDSPVKASGKMDGRVPVRFDDTGLHFGQGWAGLKRDQTTSVLFNSAGLLTSRISPKNPAYATLQKIETGRARLKVEEFHVDLHPADAPEGRSAQLRIVGRPEDPGTDLGALTLEININGPLEDLLNWGLKTEISASTGAR